MPSTSHTPDAGAPASFGTLFVVATPIGNVGDITLRALHVLSSVDLIAAEDTRKTGQLLHHHQVKSPLISFYEHNEARRVPVLIEKMKSGQSVALVSDAGTPSVSDPGYRLVTAAIDQGINVVPVPGVSAAITALSVSGMPTDTFVFIGFLDKKKTRRTSQLKQLAQEKKTLIFYESPNRLVGLFEDILSVLGDRTAVLSREMTKLHEEFIRGPVSEIVLDLKARKAIKGECTVVLAGAVENESCLDDVERDIRRSLADAEERMGDISKRLSKKYHLPRSRIYDMVLKIKKNYSGF